MLLFSRIVAVIHWAIANKTLLEEVVTAVETVVAKLEASKPA